MAVLRSVVGFIAGANRMPFAKFMIANSAGAVVWAMFYGLGAYYFGKGVEEFARPFAIALAVVGAIVVVSLIVYWRRKEQELAAAAERAIPGAVADRTVPRGRWVVPAKTSTACVKPLSVEWIASCAVASGSEYRDAACQLLLNFADGTVADLRASKLDV